MNHVLDLLISLDFEAHGLITFNLSFNLPFKLDIDKHVQTITFLLLFVVVD